MGGKTCRFDSASAGMFLSATPILSPFVTGQMDGSNKNGDPRVAVLHCVKPYAALNSLCGSITNFFGTPASNSP